jgi:hypothetical protein
LKAPRIVNENNACGQRVSTIESSNEGWHRQRAAWCIASEDHSHVAHGELESGRESRDRSAASGDLEGPRDARWKIWLLLAHHDDL